MFCLFRFKEGNTPNTKLTGQKEQIYQPVLGDHTDSDSPMCDMESMQLSCLLGCLVQLILSVQNCGVWWLPLTVPWWNLRFEGYHIWTGPTAPNGSISDATRWQTRNRPAFGWIRVPGAGEKWKVCDSRINGTIAYFPIFGKNKTIKCRYM